MSEQPEPVEGGDAPRKWSPVMVLFIIAMGAFTVWNAFMAWIAWRG